MKQRPFSKLKKQIEALFVPELNMEFCCYAYPMCSQHGGTDIPRFLVKLGKDIIWDIPKDLDKEHFSLDAFAYNAHSISELVRDYIDAPVKGLLERKFEKETYTWIAQYIGSNYQETREFNYQLTDLFKAADRRIGRENLCQWAESLNNYPATLVLVARLKDKRTFRENSLLGGLLLKHQKPMTLEDMRVQYLWLKYRKDGETKEMYLQWYKEGKFDFIYVQKDEKAIAAFEEANGYNEKIRKRVRE